MPDAYVEQVVSAPRSVMLKDEAKSVVRRALKAVKAQGYDVTKNGRIEIGTPWVELQKQNQALQEPRVVWYVGVRQFFTYTRKEPDA